MNESEVARLIQLYWELRDQTDRTIQILLDIHSDQITCQQQCCDCCTNLTVFPVEFFAILWELRARGVTRVTFDEAASCGYLMDRLCQIYPQRPLICRTHGLPIVFLNDEVEPAERSVSFCPLNFAESDPDQLEFGVENTLDIDELNSKFFEINREFVLALDDPDVTLETRIPLKQLGGML